MATKEDVHPVGIDLGTHNSCVAVYFEDKLEVLLGPSGKKTVPSKVAFSKTDYDEVVGDAADTGYEAENVVTGVKRLLGRDFDCEQVQKEKKFLPYQLVNDAGRPLIQVQHNGKTASYFPEEISSKVLRHLKSMAEKRLGKPVNSAVLTVPAYFDQRQRQATVEAAKSAGLEVHLLKEPIAAAIAYGLDLKLEGDEKRTVLVYDLGAGTFDVTVLDLDKENLEVKAIGGDSYLGGRDFTNKIIEHFAKQIEKKHKQKDILKGPGVLGRLTKASENIKKKLSVCSNAREDTLDNLLPGVDFTPVLTRNEFVQLNEEAFAKTISITKDTLKSKELNVDDITDVVLIGGSSFILDLKKRITEIFSSASAVKRALPEENVARGAAVHAAMLRGTCPAILRRVILADVLSMSLRVGVYGGLTKIIAERNEIVTDPKTLSVTTASKDQKGISFDFFEGERPLAKDNTLLGSIELKNLKAGPRGLAAIDVIFESDPYSNFIFTVRDKGTGRQEILTVKSKAKDMDDEDLESVRAKAHESQSVDAKEESRLRARVRLALIVEDVARTLTEEVPDADASCVVDATSSWLKSGRGKIASEEEYEKRYAELCRILEKTVVPREDDEEVEFL